MISEYTDQRDAIITRINTVADIGQVHNRPRYGDAFEHWRFELNGVVGIRGWEVGVGEEGTRVERITANHRHRYRAWEVRGYVEVGDDPDGNVGTYSTINDLALSVANAIDADRDLNGSAIDLTFPVQIDDPTTFEAAVGPLCWTVLLTFEAYTIVSP